MYWCCTGNQGYVLVLMIYELSILHLQTASTTETKIFPRPPGGRAGDVTGRCWLVPGKVQHPHGTDPGAWLQEESLPTQLCIPHGCSGPHMLQECLEVPGFTWKQCCFISEGDIPGSVHDAPCSAPTGLCRGATAPSHCHGNRGVPLYSGAEQPLGWDGGRKAANSHAWADDKTRVGSAPSGLH